MLDRIRLSAAAQLGRGEHGHAVIGRAKMQVLAGQHEMRSGTVMK